MMKFTVLVIALVLAPGLYADVVSIGHITNYPGIYVPAIETRPLPIETIPELRPEAVPVIPETKPLPLPEEEIVQVIPETKPVPVEANPCEACFSYMATLIDQLTETVEPQLPEFLPESPVEVEIQPHPEPSPPAVILPQPAPELPEVELRPLPIFPDVPQVELRPLPIFPEVPQLEVRPLPIRVPALANF